MLSDKILERMAQDVSFRVRNNQELIRTKGNEPIAAVAKYDMAQCYRHGWGVSINYKESIKLYDESAKMGHAGACYELARLYLQGHTLMDIKIDLSLSEYYSKLGLDKCQKIGSDMDFLNYKNSDYVPQLNGLLKTIEFCKWSNQNRF